MKVDFFIKLSVNNSNDGFVIRRRNLFISKGQAVIIGECGAMNRDNEDYRAQWAQYYFSKFREIGIPCFWWDNGAFLSGETFGLFDRSLNEVKYPALLEGMMKGASGEAPETADEAA